MSSYIPSAASSNMELDSRRSKDTVTKSNSPPPASWLDQIKSIWTHYLGSDTWTKEITACFISLVVVAGTWLVLMHYNRSPIPVVLPGDIKIGSILSIFATLLKLTIGVPLSAGLGQLIWVRLKERHGLLLDVDRHDEASRGVIGGLYLLYALSKQKGPSYTAILGVLCGFSALAIGPFIQNTLGTINVTGPSTLPRCEEVYGPDLGKLFNQYQASVFLSDFAPTGQSEESLRSLNMNCSTGNCKYPLFSSLAICSETTDLYPLVNRNLHANGTLRSLTLPNGLSLPNIDGTSVMYWNGSTTYPTQNYENWAYPPLAKFSILYYHEQFFQDNNTADFRAAEGVFYWCVQSYSPTVKNGVLDHPVVATWRPESLNTSSPTQILSPPPSAFASLGLNQQTNFTIVDQDTYIDFIKLSVDINNTNYSPPNQLEVIAGLRVPDFGIFFSYLASAASNRMRSQLCTDTPLAVGTMDRQLLLNVEWGWMALPTATTLLACWFFAMVVHQSKKQGVGAWRSSALVAMFHGFSPEARDVDEMKSAVLLSEMEKFAEKTSVKLSKGEGPTEALMLRR